MTEASAARRAYFGLGSNLGDRAAHLQVGLDGLAARAGRVVAISPVYETQPVHCPPGSQNFLNAVVLADTTLAANRLLDRALAIEDAYDRDRSTVPNAPRTLDVDVVTVIGDDGTPVLSDDPTLTLPHPRAHERAFVLVPWLTLDPGAVLPGHGRVADLVAALPPEDVAAVKRWDHLH